MNADERLRQFIQRGSSLNAPATHSWAADVRNGSPVMTCTNAHCNVVWWPDRSQPGGPCPKRRRSAS